MRRKIATGDFESLSAKPSLIDNARALVATGQTNEAELQRVFGIIA